MFWKLEGKVEAVCFSETTPTEDEITEILLAEIQEGGGFKPQELYASIIREVEEIPPEWTNCPAWKYDFRGCLGGGPLIQEVNFVKLCK